MWKYIARSAIGVGHQQLTLPCQDYSGCQIKGRNLIGVVADGAGSAKFGELGSRCVVKSALKFMTNNELQSRCQPEISPKKVWQALNTNVTPKQVWRLLNTNVDQLLKPTVHFPDENIVREFFIDLAEECLQDLKNEARQNNCDVKNLASTLLVFIADAEWLVAMQVGDGLLVVRERGQKDYQLVMKPQKGEFTNQTVFVTSDGAIDNMQTVVVPKPCDFICAATDGVESVAVRLSDWSPFAPFFMPLEEYLKETDEPEQNDQYLIDFLNSDRLNARTDDDKTLLIALNYDSTH